MNTGEERFEFTARAKKNLMITMVVGVVLAVAGLLMAKSGGGHGEADHSDDHTEQVAHASSEKDGHGDATHDDEHKTSAEDHAGAEEHHVSPPWVKRLFSNLWINVVFFGGLSLIGVFFFAVQYAAQAGWSAGVKRIPLAFGSWLPIAFLLILAMFLIAGGDLFHWTHASAFVDDAIMQKKSPFFYWPLSPESGIPAFWLGRLILFFGVWYFFFTKLRKLALEEDLEAGTDRWLRMRKLSAGFLVFFAFSSSIAAWDWVMSIDTHWFSTMFGWYNFASWWVAGLALTTFLVVTLKDQGYLAIVNENHIHDLGKFVFAFSIFWTYVWFSQFLLIYYAHIPEETVYFMDRWKGPYAGVFYFNLIINFFFPFLVLMTRDSKRHSRILKVVCPAVVFGHWMDFYLMVTPGTLKFEGGFGFLEIGLIMVFMSAFLFVVLRQLAKAPLYARNHPMLEESLHHHI